MVITYSYCHPLGLSILKLASEAGCTRSNYTVQLIERGRVDQDMINHLDFHVSDGMTIPDLLEYIRSCDMTSSIPTNPSNQFLSDYVDSRIVEDEILESHHKHISGLYSALMEYQWSPAQGRFDCFISRRKPELLSDQMSLYKKMPVHIENFVWTIAQNIEYS